MIHMPQLEIDRSPQSAMWQNAESPTAGDQHERCPLPGHGAGWYRWSGTQWNPVEPGGSPWHLDPMCQLLRMLKFGEFRGFDCKKVSDDRCLLLHG